MNGYCNGCENHCAANDLHCERGYRNLNEGDERRERGGHFDTLPIRPGEGMEGRFDILPIRPGEGVEGRFDTLPMRPGHGGRRGGPRDEGFDRGMAPDFGDIPGGMAPHDGPGMPPHGMGPHGRGPHGRGPSHGGGPSHGRGPGMPPRMPSGETLRERIGEAGLPELIGMAGRLMPRRPGHGSARGQALILSILAGREELSQRELQQMLGVQPGSMSEIVSKLEKKGFLTRERGEDRRGNLLRITDEGRAALPEKAGDEDDDLFAALTGDERATLAKLLRALLADWVDRPEPSPEPMEPHGPFMPPERMERI